MDLPTPAGPVSVTSRATSSSSTRAARSSSRPISSGVAAGMRPADGAGATSSPARISRRAAARRSRICSGVPTRSRTDRSDRSAQNARMAPSARPSGTTSPRSQRCTVRRLTSSDAAQSSWVMPNASRTRRSTPGHMAPYWRAARRTRLEPPSYRRKCITRHDTTKEMDDGTLARTGSEGEPAL